MVCFEKVGRHNMMAPKRSVSGLMSQYHEVRIRSHIMFYAVFSV